MPTTERTASSSSNRPDAQEVLTILGPTPELAGGAKECINTAAVDPLTKSVLANDEDGKLYRWDLTTNTLSQTVVLMAGLGEAYTSTVIGPDGKVYANNNATLRRGGSISRASKCDVASVRR